MLMLAAIINHPCLFWLVFGGLLLVAELLITSGYLFWTGLSAILTGLLTSQLPLPLLWQAGLFSLLTLILALLWYRWIQRDNPLATSERLNQRGIELIGSRFILEQALKQRATRIKIGDSSWRAQAESDLPAGCEVEVIAIKGITLYIRPWMPVHNNTIASAQK